jgi:CPA2 family monovalent cation:H+ antiporter-2
MIDEIFLILTAALLGGVLVKYFKLQPIVGYVISGIVFGLFVSHRIAGVDKLADIGAILLLFSVGVELSLQRLSRILKIAIVGGVVQMISTTLVLLLILSLIGFSIPVSLILAMGFSLSSTAIVVKVLSDRGETETIYGELMLGWLLVQDIAVIAMMIIASSFASQSQNWFLPSIYSLLKAGTAIILVVALGRLIVPYLMHKIASLNSRELLVIASVALAMGTAMLTSFFGISVALGAFLAGVVVSETQEKHAVFAETRPLRDLFVAMFFVTLGFLVEASVFLSSFWLILVLAAIIIVVKFFAFLFVNLLFHYRGKTAFFSSLGLTQVGEFSFILFSQSLSLGIFDQKIASIGIATTLVLLIITPLTFRYSHGLYRKLKDFCEDYPLLKKFFSSARTNFKTTDELINHVVICGFGRVGRWVAKALESVEIDFLVIDYNQDAVNQASQMGIKTIYGDPSEEEVIDKANIKNAKAVVIAIPDRVVQEELITQLQTISPNVKIFSRAHHDEDAQRLKFLRVDSVIQPEFEASIAITRQILAALGKDKKEINSKIKGLRQSHSQSK